MKKSMKKLLIVGGVAAGATAAARARRLSDDIEITVLEAGPDISFANCGLPYFIGGDIESRSSLILQSPEAFKVQYDVDVKTMTEVVGIDRETKTVEAKNKLTNKIESYSYDKLILAQGGRPIVPPLPGVDKSHVFSLWTLRDMDAIQQYIQRSEPKTAVVVGGGFIGLEMVEALRKRGMKVSVVERLPQVMATVEAEIAGFLVQEMHALGIDIHTKKSVIEILDSSVKLDCGTEISADIVIMSVGVKPTLKLAESCGLEIGEAHGLKVNEYLQTSDPDIFAAGDMVEIDHLVNGQKVRIPLAGPANRQGRIAATNALGQQRPYPGALGTSIVRVFEAVVGSTGLGLSRARAAGIEADSIVIHKEHHTSYYPGSTPVTVMLIYDHNSGVIVGGQTAGYAGADRRLDVLATAVAAGMTVSQLAAMDFAYSPPLGTANDPLNVAAFVAENKINGHSPSISAAELEQFAKDNNALIIDVRDSFSWDRGHIEAANHIPLNRLSNSFDKIDAKLASPSQPILVVCQNGKKAHKALRQFVHAGYNAVNASGGFISIERFARAHGYEDLSIKLGEIEPREPNHHEAECSTVVQKVDREKQLSGDAALILDVRTPREFKTGAHPKAVNLPLDELDSVLHYMGSKSRQILVYCASGARSAYAFDMLKTAGFCNVENGGGVMEVMDREI